MRLNRMILRRLRICSKALPCEVRRRLDRYPPYNNMTTSIHGGESNSFPLSDTSEKVAPWLLWSPTILDQVAWPAIAPLLPWRFMDTGFKKTASDQHFLLQAVVGIKNMR